MHTGTQKRIAMLGGKGGMVLTRLQHLAVLARLLKSCLKSKIFDARWAARVHQKDGGRLAAGNTAPVPRLFVNSVSTINNPLQPLQPGTTRGKIAK